MAEGKPGRVIIISGPVGAGKSTVSKAFVKLATVPAAFIEGDSFWSHLIRPFAENEETHPNFRAVIRASVMASIAYAVSGFEAVLDFSIPPGFVEGIVKLAGSRDIRIDYVVLRPALTICMERAAQRTHWKVDNYDQYHKLYQSFDKMPAHIIDNSREDAEAVALRIKEALDTQHFRIK